MNIPRKRKRPLFSRIGPWALLALAVLFIAGFISFRIWFNRYLRSDEFRNLIGGLTSKQIKADGHYEPFTFNDGAIYSDGFKAQGTPEASYTSLEADQLRARINLAGLWNRAWQIDEIDIQRLQVALGHAASTAEPGPGPELVPQEPQPAALPSLFSNWLPNHVDLRKVIIHDTDLKWGDATMKSGAITNAEVTITPDGDAWKILCDSGTVSEQGQPDLSIDEATLRYQRPTLYITDAALRYNSESSIDLSGQVDFEKDFQVQAKLNSIPISPLLARDWREKLKGKLNGTVKISALLPMTAGPDVEGDLSLAEGELEALPVLDEIATFTSSQRYRRVSLTKVAAHFTRTDALLKVDHLIAESEGLICVKGDFVVENGNIDGNFDVGISPASMEWLPPALQNKVFTASHDGYLWTTMHLSGPVDHPVEDLSKRLIMAAPGAIIDTAKGVIDQVPGAGTAVDEGKKAVDTFLSPFFGN